MSQTTTLAAPATDIRVPTFDVLMLGVGGEGHTASLFPDTPYVREQQRTVVGVHDCPKPPPTRPARSTTCGTR